LFTKQNIYIFNSYTPHVKHHHNVWAHIAMHLGHGAIHAIAGTAIGAAAAPLLAPAAVVVGGAALLAAILDD
jgi:hypothetical protein